MAVTIAQVQAVDAQARLAVLETLASAEAAANAAILARLAPLATSIVGTQHGTVTTLAVLSRLPPLESVATVSGHQTLAAVSRLSLATAAGLTAAQHLTALSWIGPLRASVRVQGTNINTVVATVTLPPLRGAAGMTALASLHAASLLHMATAGTTGAQQTLQATAQLRMTNAGAMAAATTTRITATLGALATSITAGPPPAGYAADGQYYIAIAARPFYATLEPRAFLCVAGARPFYILSNPNMTPSFNTLDPRETAVLTLDASADLASGETLTGTPNITAVQQSGLPGTLPTLTGPIINSEPITLTLNGKTITIAAGCAAQVVVTGGVSGCSYLVAAVCETSNPDKVLTLKGVLPVSAN